MTLAYKDIFAIVSTLDDCLMMDEDGSSEIKVSDSCLVISRELQRGALRIVFDEGSTGTCCYHHYLKNWVTGKKSVMIITDY